MHRMCRDKIYERKIDCSTNVEQYAKRLLQLMIQDNSRLYVAIQVKTELGTTAKKSGEIARRPIGLSQQRGLVHPQHIARFLNPISGVLECSEKKRSSSNNVSGRGKSLEAASYN